MKGGRMDGARKRGLRGGVIEMKGPGTDDD
jgi:hypothetical protein